jgi:hypothetical protein
VDVQFFVVEAEADDAFGVDTDDRCVETMRTSTRNIQSLCPSTDFDTPDPPWIYRCDVVHDKRDPPVLRDIVKLTAARHVVTADVDRGCIRGNCCRGQDLRTCNSFRLVKALFCFVDPALGLAKLILGLSNRDTGSLLCVLGELSFLFCVFEIGAEFFDAAVEVGQL